MQFLPVLSGHLGRSLRCLLNRGFTVWPKPKKPKKESTRHITMFIIKVLDLHTQKQWCKNHLLIKRNIGWTIFFSLWKNIIHGFWSYDQWDHFIFPPLQWQPHFGLQFLTSVRLKSRHYDFLNTTCMVLQVTKDMIKITWL